MSERIQEAATSASTEHIISELRGVEKLLDKKTPLWGTGYEAVIVGIAAVKLETLQCERQERENLVTLACDGCRYEKSRKLFPLTVNDSCQRCTRLPQRSDRYEPKGEASP